MNRGFSGVVQRLAELPHSTIQPALKVNERLGRPQHVPELVARHDLAWPTEQCLQNLERLIGKAHCQAMPAELARLGVELKDAEAKNVRVRRRDVHGFLGGGAESIRLYLRMPVRWAAKPFLRSHLFSHAQVSVETVANAPSGMRECVWLIERTGGISSRQSRRPCGNKTTS